MMHAITAGPRIVAVAATLAAATMLSLSAQPSPASAPALSHERTRQYAGSKACQPCHRPAFEQWRQSVHVRMTQPIREAKVGADFSAGTVVRGTGYAYAVKEDRARRTVTVGRDGLPPETHGVQFTLGEKRLQGYMSTLPDGRIYVLPVFWHNDWQRWIDWKAITPVRGAPDDSRQIWNVNCFNCHATNIQRNFDTSIQSFSTTWTEMGVGCESCHGPGRTHVERLVAWGKDPASYPEIALERPGADLSAQLAIFVPRSATPRQVYDSCAYCHGNKTNYFTGFTPGDHLEDFAQFALISDPVPATDPQGDYWPDGRPSRFNRPQALTLSGCFRKGQATCATCHAAHGSPNEHSLKVPLAQADSLCTQCHTTLGEAGRPGLRVPADGPTRSAHTRHAPDAPGSRCIDCHMSDVNWRLLTRRRDHTFAPPSPELTARYGVPNACTTCHDDRSPEWAAQTMDHWYGDRDRRGRALRVADGFYGAATGDPAAEATVVRLAVDRTNGALIRASAAGFLGRPGANPAGASPRAVNALVAAASDPDAMVRAAAVRSLGHISEARATAALAARLMDTARVVRATAAESLLFAGVSALPGEAGRALEQAQDEYAESLRTFGDVSSHHTSLGWLLAARGSADAAERELDVAVALDPTDPRPRVYLGVLAARAERFGAAVAHWNDARRLNPSYPNIDRLIAEANRQARQR